MSGNLVVVAAIVAVVAVGGWCLTCINRAYAQRSRLINGSRDLRDFEALNCVTYDAHVWALVLMRDPFDLYDPEFIARTKADRS